MRGSASAGSVCVETCTLCIQLFRQRLSHKSVKAYATMPIGIMGGQSLALIDIVKRTRASSHVSCAIEAIKLLLLLLLLLVHGVSQEETRKHKYIGLCCFPLYR